MIGSNTPPRWATYLLRKLGHASLQEEVEGDLQELFVLWQQEYGLRRARWKYILAVLTLIRPFKRNLRSANEHPETSTGFHMINSYLVMGWRTMRRNKVSSLINISGLTLGLATAILIMLVIADELKYDTFHRDLDRNYFLMTNQTTSSGISTGKSSAGPIAEALRTDFPEVTYAARVGGWSRPQVVADGKSSQPSAVYVDPDLFRMMTFNTQSGDPVKAIERGSSIVITRNQATILFGEEDPMNKMVVVDKTHTFTVGAVIEDVPATSTLTFGMAMPFSAYEVENKWLTKWDDFRIQTWMQLQPDTNLELFNKKMTQLLQTRTDDKTLALFAYPMKDLHLYGRFSNGQPTGGKITAVWILAAFGIFMLAVACINFMNISTAQSDHRAREVGVRKVLGASRGRIIAQFLNESFLVSLCSLVAALAIVVLVIPSFNELIHASITFDPTNINIWLLVIVIGALTAVLAGIYPAIFLSRFLPVQVLKGRTGQTRSLFRTVLVTFQFVISSFFLISTIIMYLQFAHLKDRPIGYEQENLISLPLDATLSSKFNYVRNELLTIPEVTGVTGASGSILSVSVAVTGMDWTGKTAGEELTVRVTDVEYDWAKTTGISIVAGRDFSPSFESDKTACLINESAVMRMGLKEPIGSEVGGSTVIGVFKDYVYNNPAEEIEPLAVYLRPENMHVLYLRVRNDEHWREAMTAVEKVFKATSPEHLFSFSFTKEDYQNQFQELTDGGLMVCIFGGMTIFISCLGLFGLSGFVAERRSKEMTIRKVFGASVVRVLLVLSQDFLRPVFVALLIVLPVTVFAAKAVLSMVAYRIPLHWWIFGGGAGAVLVLASVVVLYHGWRTAHENPVDRLRSE